MILVTGATGFVGGHVVHTLLGRNRAVRCLVRDRKRAERLAGWGCELVEGDIADPEALRRAVEGCEAVIHLVAIMAGRPEDFDRVMSGATRDLVSAAREVSVGRFFLMSALGTGEATKDTVPYYRAKWEMEQAVTGSGLPATIFRPSFVFGPDGGLLPPLVRLARVSPVLPVPGDGTQRLQPIWVEDVAAFFAAALDEEAGGTYDLVGPDAVSWDELFVRVARALGKQPALVHVPLGLLRVPAAIAELLPHPPVTQDMITMLELGDNVGDRRPAIEAFGVEPIGLSEQLARVPR